ncbi:MAG TPA: glycoside hydrolase family 9 protein [Trebonia sp.]|nr:glycoside hydrolase family 9 protein [Trebonia sp.]
MRNHTHTWSTIAVMLAATVSVATLAAPAAQAQGARDLSRVSVARTTPELRVDQVGYSTSTSKVAYLMVPARVTRVNFTVVGTRGVAFRGTSTDDVGSWNSRYRAVYALTFSALRRPGTYRIRVGSTVSPAFRIADGRALYQGLVANGVKYFTSERDGADVVSSVLDRKPANLTDTRAYVYADPRYDSNDNLIGGLKRIGGPVDVSGGWFDAGGGYEKFGYTASYADALLLIMARDVRGPNSSALRAEAEFGLNWMQELWNPAKKVMYIQVGIGNGNNSIDGDYDFWFQPQAEDRLGAKPGAADYYVEYRPVFEAAAPGKKVSPELAGRYAADYALGAQLAVSGGRGSGRASSADRVSAERLLALARSVYAMAQTRNVRSIVTAFPHDYYPGTEWKSAMLWGAAEIALADERVGVPRPVLRHDLAVAASWARAYIAQGHPAGGDTLNLYDNGAVAEAELLRAMRGAHVQPVIAPRLLLGDMAEQLRVGEAWAHGDPFGLGTDLGPSDAAPHAFGLYVTDMLYQENGGSSAYAAFAQQQLGYALGANPWGASFVVGAGSAYPHCMQSEIANLSGSLTGTGKIQVGATVDGPSSPDNFVGLGTVTGMRACSYGSYAQFDNSAAGYEDNVVSWPSVEPSLDYSAISLFAFSLGASPRGHRLG